MSKSRTSGLQIPYICERFQKPNATERYRTPPKEEEKEKTKEKEKEKEKKKEIS